MRYWPLTAVLLAFWMGRETGAGDDEKSDEGKIAKFGVVEAKYLVVDLIRVRTLKSAGKPRYITLGDGRIEIHDAGRGGSSLEMRADKIQVGNVADRYLNINSEGIASYNMGAKEGEPIGFVGVMKPVMPDKKGK